MCKNYRKIILTFIVLFFTSIFFLAGCSGNPEENLINNLEKRNFSKVVKIYNSSIFGTDLQNKVDIMLETEIYTIVEKWDSNEIELEIAVERLEVLSNLENTNLSELAEKNYNLVRIEGTGKLLHIQAEDYYAHDKIAEAMDCVSKIDKSYSQYDNAIELYNICEKVILETVATPYSSADCKDYINKLNEYLKIVDNEAFLNRKIQLEKLIDQYIEVEAIISDAAKLYDTEKYKQCFKIINDGLKKYPKNNLLQIANDNCHGLYVIKVTQKVLKLCESKKYKEALNEVNVAKEIYNCTEFIELEDSVRKQKSLIYRIATSISDKFKAFTQDGEGETLTVKEIGSKSGAYVVKSGKKLLLGDYSNEKITALSF